MINSTLVVSGNISGSNSALSLPGPISITGSPYARGGIDSFDVSEQRGFSMQAFVTGSNVTGTLSLQQSNNMAGWVTVPTMTASFAGAQVSQDVLFSQQYNTAGYARLLWSGSAASGSSISIAKAGNS
jgi:hypothetical protein